MEAIKIVGGTIYVYLKKAMKVSTLLLFRETWDLQDTKHVAVFSVAQQAPLSTGFSRQEYWSGLPFSYCSFCSLTLKRNAKKAYFGNSLAAQWLGLHAFTAEGRFSLPGQGTKILQPQNTTKCFKIKKMFFFPKYVTFDTLVVIHESK